MAEIKENGYQDLRDYIQSNWNKIEMQDGTGTKVIRLSTDDPRVEWTHGADNSTLKLQIVVKGSDSDITAPKTFAKSVIFNVASGGSSISEENFTEFTIEGDDDELTVIHSIEVPKA